MIDSPQKYQQEVSAMSHVHSTISKRSFKHLTPIQRGQIQALLEQKVAKTHIAKQLGIARSTLYYEIKRGTAEQVNQYGKTYYRYFADTGQLVYEQRRKHSRHPFKFALVQPFLQYVTEQIKTHHLSPDAARGRAVRDKRFPHVVSTKTLYNYINLQLIPVKNIDLPLRVRLRISRRRARRHRRLTGSSIEQRPEPINSRKEFGHWEIDTIVNARNQGPVLLVLDERMTRKRHMVKIENKTAAAVKQGLQQILAQYPDTKQSVFKSITSDNGSEFAQLTEHFPSIRFYYAHPYSSFERGTNEKQNSLVRRFIPKGSDLAKVSSKTIAMIEHWINELPRKIFAYEDAESKFQIELSRVS